MTTQQDLVNAAANKVTGVRFDCLKTYTADLLAGDISTSSHPGLRIRSIGSINTTSTYVRYSYNLTLGRQCFATVARGQGINKSMTLYMVTSYVV